MEKVKATAFISYDVSGSIDNQKKEYFKKVYEYYNNEYESVKIIEHTTVGKFSEIDKVLGSHDKGGTYISSGLKLALGEIVSRGNVEDVVVICGDGDNWSEDNDRVFNLIDILDEHCKVDYFEFLPSTYATTMYEMLSNRYELGDNDISLYQVTNKKQDIFGEELEDKVSININKVEENKENVSLDVFIANKLVDIADKLDKIYKVIKPIETQSVTLNVENINSTDFDELIESIKKYQGTSIS